MNNMNDRIMVRANNKEELFNELIYTRLLNYIAENCNLSAKLNKVKITDIVPVEGINQFVIYKKNEFDAGEHITDLRELKILRDTILSLNNESTSKLDDVEGIYTLQSLASLIKITEFLFNKQKISYNNRCQLLKDISVIIALDYAVGMGKRHSSDILLAKSDITGKYRYIAANNNFSLLSDETSFKLVSNNYRHNSFEVEIENFANRNNFSPYLDYFQNNYKELLNKINEGVFEDAIYDALNLMPRNYRNVPLEELLISFQKQRINKLERSRNLDRYR